MSRNILRVALTTAALLMVPAVAMQFTNEVNWGPGDFLIMGALLFGAGTAYVLITRNIAGRVSRIGVGARLALALLAVWAELSVGIF